MEAARYPVRMSDSAVSGLILTWVLLSLLVSGGSVALGYWMTRLAVRGGMRDHYRWVQGQMLRQEFPEEFAD